MEIKFQTALITGSSRSGERRGARQMATRLRHSGSRTGGWQPFVGMGPAKAALESVSRYFAVALARYGVTVNTVSPGCSDESRFVTGQGIAVDGGCSLMNTDIPLALQVPA